MTCCGKLVPFVYVKRAQKPNGTGEAGAVVRIELVRTLPEYIRHLVERHEKVPAGIEPADASFAGSCLTSLATGPQTRT